MTENTMDLAQLQQLLEAEWLPDEHKEILKDVIKRAIKLMPKMLDMMEKEF